MEKKIKMKENKKKTKSTFCDLDTLCYKLKRKNLVLNNLIESTVLIAHGLCSTTLAYPK